MNKFVKVLLILLIILALVGIGALGYNYVQKATEEVQKRLKDMLSKFPGIKGINNHMGSKFTEDKERMQAVMEVLREEGLFFLDSKTTAKSVGKETAQEQGVSYASRNVFIDNENKVEYIQKQLGIAEESVTSDIKVRGGVRRLTVSQVVLRASVLYYIMCKSENENRLFLSEIGRPAFAGRCAVVFRLGTNRVV